MVMDFYEDSDLSAGITSKVTEVVMAAVLTVGLVLGCLLVTKHRRRRLFGMSTVFQVVICTDLMSCCSHLLLVSLNAHLWSPQDLTGFCQITLFTTNFTFAASNYATLVLAADLFSLVLAVAKRGHRHAGSTTRKAKDRINVQILLLTLFGLLIGLNFHYLWTYTTQRELANLPTTSKSATGAPVALVGNTFESLDDVGTNTNGTPNSEGNTTVSTGLESGDAGSVVLLQCKPLPSYDALFYRLVHVYLEPFVFNLLPLSVSLVLSVGAMRKFRRLVASRVAPVPVPVPPPAPELQSGSVTTSVTTQFVTTGISDNRVDQCLSSRCGRSGWSPNCTERWLCGCHAAVLCLETVVFVSFLCAAPQTVIAILVDLTDLQASAHERGLDNELNALFLMLDCVNTASYTIRFIAFTVLELQFEANRISLRLNFLNEDNQQLQLTQYNGERL